MGVVGPFELEVLFRLVTGRFVDGRGRFRDGGCEAPPSVSEGVTGSGSRLLRFILRSGKVVRSQILFGQRRFAQTCSGWMTGLPGFCYESK